MTEIFSKTKALLVKFAMKVRERHIWLMIVCVNLFLMTVFFPTDSWSESILRLVVALFAYFLYVKSCQIDSMVETLRRSFKVLDELLFNIEKLKKETKNTNEDEIL